MKENVIENQLLSFIAVALSFLKAFNTMYNVPTYLRGVFNWGREFNFERLGVCMRDIKVNEGLRFWIILVIR